MILTEKEAAKRECPWGVDDTCVASRCMAWRQEKLPYSKQTAERIPEGTIIRKGQTMVMCSTGRGWCGLAGKP